MANKETLHQLLEVLPESEWEEVQHMLEKHLAKHDPVLRTFQEAPEDDEPETEEERKAVAEAYEDLKGGRVYRWEEVKRELGL